MSSPDVEGEGGARDESSLDGREELSDAELAAAEAARQEQGEQQEGEEGEEQPGEKFRLGEFEFESPEQAANEFKRALGRLKSAGAEVSKARHYATVAVNTAVAWQNWAQQQVAQGHNQPGVPSDGAGPQGEGPAQAPPDIPDLATFADRVDWGQVQEVQDEYGSVVAQNFLMRKLAKEAAAYARAQVEQAVAPHNEARQQLQVLNGLDELFTQASQAVESEGGPTLYPELAVDAGGDLEYPEVASIIIDLFKEAVQEGFPPTPRTVHHAVLEFRRLCAPHGGVEALGVTTNHARSSSQPRGGGRPGNGIGAQVRRSLASAGEAAASALASGGAPMRPKRGPASPADELEADFQRARARTDSVFGVAR